jgi:Dyp-type peroxidase family
MIDLADLQGDVLRGYTYPSVSYLFLKIVDPQRMRDLMRRMLPQVSTAEPWVDGPPPTALHAAFTYNGLVALGLDESLLATFPDEFREGMAARAERLGDRGPSAPSNWEPGLGTGEAHVLVTLYGVDEERLQQAREALREVGAAGAIRIVHEQRGAALDQGRDHFGFADGIAQPAIEDRRVAGRPGDGLVRTGEFVHGYEDEDGLLPAAPGAPFDRNGTFAVYRKLQMDVAAFRRFVRDAGYPGGPELLAAKLVGRWPDGTPLVRHRGINDFSYADDPDGHACPLGAHIRRANPRDSPGFFGGRLSGRHRLIRRGRSYGPPLPPGVTEDDGIDRGLIFVCFNASLWRQFETVQALWIDDGDPFGLGPDKDFLVGEPHGTAGKMTIQGHPPFFIKPQPRFVTMRGGEYLFRPSMTGLRFLAGA